MIKVYINSFIICTLWFCVLVNYWWVTMALCTCSTCAAVSSRLAAFRKLPQSLILRKKNLDFSMTPCRSVLTHSSFTRVAEYIKERWRIKDHCVPFGWTLKENKEYCNLLHVALDTLTKQQESALILSKHGTRFGIRRVFALISPDHFQVLNVHLNMSLWVNWCKLTYKFADVDCVVCCCKYSLNPKKVKND